MSTLPEFIDEMIDPNDPLAILLAREGSNEEAYELAREYRSGQQQFIERSLIEEGVEDSDGTWIKRTRRMSGNVIKKH